MLYTEQHPKCAMDFIRTWQGNRPMSIEVKVIGSKIKVTGAELKLNLVCRSEDDT